MLDLGKSGFSCSIGKKTFILLQNTLRASGGNRPNHQEK
jgi:hypothetical protein